MNEATYKPKEAWPFVNYLDTGSITDNRIKAIQHLELSKDELPSRARRKVRPGDIVFSTVRPNQRHFGLLRDIPENFLVSTGFAVMRARENIADAGFLYWFLSQEKIVGQLHTIAEHSTSAYPSIRPADIEGLEVNLPSTSEQRAIARVLGALDDKIELNRRMNETLEAMARAIFKDWFVDFGPTRAKAEGRAPYLPPELWNLFPAALKNSVLGEIPDEKRWKVGVLADIVEILSGGTPKTSVLQYWDGGIPWYTAKDAPSLSDVFVLATERTVTQAGIDNSAAKVLPARTTTITARGTVGRLACLGVPMAMNQTCYGIRGAHGHPDFFTYWNVRATVDKLRQRTHGTIFDTITRQTFKLVETALPPLELAKAFESVVTGLMERILKNLHESSILAETRDLLLPKLMSGELRLRDAGRAVEAVA